MPAHGRPPSPSPCPCSADAGSASPLGQITSQWIERTLGYANALPWVLPPKIDDSEKWDVSVSFGFGGNHAKRVGEQFELSVLKELSNRGYSVILDEGGSAEEQLQAKRIAGLTGCQTHQGSFASFLKCIQQSRLYIGYDSAGQHAAAALGLPSITAFKGFVDARMLSRWSPWGRGRNVVIEIDTQTETEAALPVLSEASSVLA